MNEEVKVEDYSPTDEQKKTIQRVYKEFEEMRKARNLQYGYFNDRTLKDYVDDSEKRLNSYVLSKASQGKEEWQANVFHPTTRNKAKALVASMSNVPEMRFRALNKDGEIDGKRADLMKNLVNYSIEKEGNPEEKVFFEGWEAAGKGTVIVYDGHTKTKHKVRKIKSFDLATGDIEEEETEEVVDEGCISYIVPLLNFYPEDFYIYDVQKQGKLVYTDYGTREKLELEFGKYKNWQYVKTANMGQIDENTYFNKEWIDRVKQDQIEIIRYYNKPKDSYVILANGVVLLDAPMLWGKKRKLYPFSKTVFEAFSSDFFYGNSLPNTLMGEQDVINTLWNMSIDKTYRSLVPALLVGLANKDDLDLEDQIVAADTKIYVSDINQIKEMQRGGVTAPELKMIELVSRGLDLTSVDNTQQGVSGSGSTAREIVLADEHAKKLKGIFYMFLQSLWLQKIKLRVTNILMNYTIPEVVEVVGDDGGKVFKELYGNFVVDNAKLSDGSYGTLGIKMVGSTNELPSQQSLDEEEKKYKDQSLNYEKVVITPDYLDNWEYDFVIVPETFYQQSKSLEVALGLEKQNTVATLYPDIFAQNKSEFFKELMELYDDDPNKYNTEPPQPMGIPGMEGMQPGMEGQPQQPQNSELVNNLTQSQTPTLNQLAGRAV